VQITDFQGNGVPNKPQRITWDPIMAEKGGFKHFMLKEIHEQPRAVRDTTLGRISRDTGKVLLEEMKISEEEFRRVEHIRIVACGTSWHAALTGKFMIESLARLPVEVDYGSEYRYRDPVVPPTLWRWLSRSPARRPIRWLLSASLKKRARATLPYATSLAAW
jgi:glucosamine--fructose-6-phosphate aminotransferase (isomerizing)